MTGRTIVGEFICQMIRRLYPGEILRMAGIAVGLKIGVIPVRMTAFTRNINMSAVKLEPRVAVLKRCGPPCRWCMTTRANMRKLSRRMSGLDRFLIILLMAGPAVQRHIGVSIIHVALITLSVCMAAGKFEARCRMIKS